MTFAAKPGSFFAACAHAAIAAGGRIKQKWKRRNGGGIE
jgi:hypothetical protein